MDIQQTQSNPLNNAAAISNINAQAAQREVGGKGLNVDDFLDLLVTQMTNQDPLEPMEDKEFMAQMAQFSSLDEMSSLNSTMKEFVQGQQQTSASAYLGREVSILSETGRRVEGLVTAVRSDAAEGKVFAKVNGAEYDVERIQEVRLPGSESDAANSSSTSGDGSILSNVF